MAIFKKFSTENHEAKQDIAGGEGGFGFESGVYHAKIKHAYLKESGREESQAQAVSLILDINSKEYTQDVWFANKDGGNSYEKNGKEFTLGGYEIMDDICTMTLGHPLNEIDDDDVELKSVEVYEREAGGKVSKKVPTITTLKNKTIYVGITQEKRNRRKETAEGSGKYVDDLSAEPYLQNEIKKVFHDDTLLTVKEVNEHDAGKIDIESDDYKKFVETWKKANEGKIIDRRKNKGNDGAKASGTGAKKSFTVKSTDDSADKGEGEKPAKSKKLFGNK